MSDDSSATHWWLNQAEIRKRCLPCPFCGHHPAVSLAVDSDGEHMVELDGACGPDALLVLVLTAWDTDPEAAAGAAIRAWNDRA